MPPANQPIRQFVTQLKEFTAQVAVVWEACQSCGPGNVDSALFDSVNEISQALNVSFENDTLIRNLGNHINIEPDEWRAKTERLRDLCYRCVCAPQGLCFITGEAGLIPRKDQHAVFEQSLGIPAGTNPHPGKSNSLIKRK
jgi:hypothetical protein